MNELEHGYHAAGVKNDRVHQEFRVFEDAHPFPQSVVPNIPQGQQLGTIDKLAQAVVPKIVDKLNAAHWQIERLTVLCEVQQAAFDDLYKFINETALPWMQQIDDRLKGLESQPKKKPAAKKKKAPEEPPLDITEFADYDPDKDEWVPITIDGKQITGALIDTVLHLSGAADQMYSEEVISFVRNLDDRVKAEITRRFPR